MLTLLLASTVAWRMAPPVDAPAMPAGTNPRFHRIALKVEDSLERGDFAGAKKLLELLPDSTITYRIDFRGVPLEKQRTIRAGVSAGLKVWEEGAKRFTAVPTEKNPEVVFSFQKELPFEGDIRLPKGVVVQGPESPGEGPFETIIGLTKGSPKAPASEGDIQAAVMRGIGEYLGLCEVPYDALATGPNLIPVNFSKRLIPQDSSTAQATWDAVNVLREAVRDKRRIKAQRPRAIIQKESINLGKLYRGRTATFGIQVFNPSQSLLKIRVLPDCSCLSAVPQVDAKPGTAAFARGSLDTSPVEGDFRHNIMVFTNDPEAPFFQVPIEATVVLAHKILRAEGSAFVVGKGGSDYEAVVVPAADFPFTAEAAQIYAVPGTVTITPFSGVFNGEKVDRGYKVSIHLDDTFPDGRFNTEIRISRRDAKLERMDPIIWPITVQKGIAAVPSTISWGEIKGGDETSFLVSRPLQPFQILSIELAEPTVKITWEPTKVKGEYKVKLAYKGGAPLGPSDTKIVIKTDDPTQPTLEVPLRVQFRQ